MMAGPVEPVLGPSVVETATGARVETVTPAAVSGVGLVAASGLVLVFGFGFSAGFGFDATGFGLVAGVVVAATGLAEEGATDGGTGFAAAGGGWLAAEDAGALVEVAARTRSTIVLRRSGRPGGLWALNADRNTFPDTVRVPADPRSTTLIRRPETPRADRSSDRTVPTSVRGSAARIAESEAML
jgi:hypothetical protein